MVIDQHECGVEQQGIVVVDQHGCGVEQQGSGY